MRTIWLAIFALLWTTSVSAQPAPQYTAVCDDGRELVGTSYTFFDLAVDSNYRLTALGIDAFDPVIARIGEDGAVTCSDNEGNLLGSQIAVPGAGAINANAFSTQSLFRPRVDGSLQVIVGGDKGSTGRYAVVVEGLLLEPRDETDRLVVDAPPSVKGELLGVYMIGQTPTLDPLLELALPDAEQPLITCDNAGTPDCPDMLGLVDNGAILSTGGQYVGEANDAGILQTIDNLQVEYRFRSSRGRTAGSYGVIITGTAPGDPIDPRLICNNVATKISGVSAVYSDLYPAVHVLDGIPQTFWATAVGDLNPETQIPLQNSFIVVGFDGRQRVDRVRVNGYALDSPFRANSLRRFRVVLNNPNEAVVTALEAEARLHPGYQTYTFLPVEVEEIGIILLANNGGSQFVIADIQVCAAR